MATVNARDRVILSIKNAGISQAEAARRAGISPQHLSAYLLGKYDSVGFFPALAEGLGVQVAWLATGAPPGPSWWQEPSAGPSAQEVVRLVTTDGAPVSLPFLGTVTAGDGWAHESQDPDDARPFVPRPSWGVVRIQGDSAEPVVLPGQSVIVDDEQEPAPNRLVVVQLRDGRAYCKRWCPVDGHVVLASMNSGRDSTVVHLDDIERVRVVVGVLFTDRVAR